MEDFTKDNLDGIAIKINNIDYQVSDDGGYWMSPDDTGSDELIGCLETDIPPHIAQYLKMSMAFLKGMMINYHYGHGI